jgi:hypothetical protein
MFEHLNFRHTKFLRDPEPQPTVDLSGPIQRQVVPLVAEENVVFVVGGGRRHPAKSGSSLALNDCTERGPFRKPRPDLDKKVYSQHPTATKGREIEDGEESSQSFCIKSTIFRIHRAKSECHRRDADLTSSPSAPLLWVFTFVAV